MVWMFFFEYLLLDQLDFALGVLYDHIPFPIQFCLKQITEAEGHAPLLLFLSCLAIIDPYILLFSKGMLSRLSRRIGFQFLFSFLCFQVSVLQSFAWHFLTVASNPRPLGSQFGRRTRFRCPFGCNFLWNFR